VQSTVTYQDGSKVTREVTLPIVSMEGFTPKQAAGRGLVFGGRP